MNLKDTYVAHEQVTFNRDELKVISFALDSLSEDLHEVDYQILDDVENVDLIERLRVLIAKIELTDEQHAKIYVRTK